MLERDVVTAYAMGGLKVGRGSVVGTVISCIILGILRNGLTLLNVRAFYQLPATGIIIMAMLIDRTTSGKWGDVWTVQGQWPRSRRVLASRRRCLRTHHAGRAI
ncbi:MAG: hypothetical protein ABIV25_15245 [Paracoccaceae bacterium]